MSTITKFLLNVSICTVCMPQISSSFASEYTADDADGRSVAGSVGSAATLTGYRSGWNSKYVVPELKTLDTVVKAHRAFSELSNEFRYLKRALSGTNAKVRDFVNQETAVLSCIEGIVPVEGTVSQHTGKPMTATERLKTAIATLAEKYTVLKTALDEKERRIAGLETSAARLKELEHAAEEKETALKTAEATAATWRNVALTTGGSLVIVASAAAILLGTGRVKFTN